MKVALSEFVWLRNVTFIVCEPLKEKSSVLNSYPRGGLVT